MNLTVFHNLSVLILLAVVATREGAAAPRGSRCVVEAVARGGGPWHAVGRPRAVARRYLLTVVKEEDLLLMAGAPPPSSQQPLFRITCDAAPRLMWASHRDGPRASPRSLLPAAGRLVPFSNTCLTRPILLGLLKILDRKIPRPIQTDESRIREYSGDYCVKSLPVTSRTDVREKLLKNTRLAVLNAHDLWRNL